MGTSECSARLGIELRNNRRDQIRIAPMRDSGLEPGILLNNIGLIEKWIKDTLGQARSGVFLVVSMWLLKKRNHKRVNSLMIYG